MVKSKPPKNITLNLGNIPADIEGGKIKKKRGRPKKSLTEVVVKEQLPHKKFSHKANRALDQLLEATREKEKQEAEKSLRDMIKKQTASLNVLGFGLGDDWLEDARQHRAKEKEKMENLPQFGSTTLKIPPFFAVPTKKGWRLANPLTEIRNLAKRKHTLSIKVKRANVKKPELDYSIPRELPTFESFSKKDQAKLTAYYEAVKEGKENEYLFKNKPRGFPATLYKNAERAGYKETSKKVYRKNDLKAKSKPTGKVGRPQAPPRLLIERVFDEEVMKPKEKDEADKFIEKAKEYISRVREKVSSSKITGAEIKKLMAEKDKLKEEEEKIGSEKTKDIMREWRKVWNEAVEKYREGKTEGKGIKVNLEQLDAEGGSLLGSLGDIAYKKLVKPTIGDAKKNIHRLTHPKETIKEIKDFGRHLIHGRHDAYPPSVKKILDANKDAIVQEVSLRRTPLSSVYTTIMSWATKGETDKRIKQQPKDTLYHIAMWVKLSNGKTIKVEKNEVINMVVNPKKPKEEQFQEVPNPPPDLSFGEMLERARAEVGDKKFFSYSAKDNNCGNFIEYILKANGMNNQATHDFIGQDAKAILKGFPSLRKLMNTLTDIAGRANVVLEGGDIDAQTQAELRGGDIDAQKQAINKGCGLKEEEQSQVIDWEDIKWGSFTKQFEEYKRQHPSSKIEDLEHFAKSILANPSDYRKTTLKRARFYLNVLLKKKSHHNNIMPHTQGGRVLGLMKPAVLPHHAGHPAMISDQFPRIPQAYTQVHLTHPRPIGHGLGAGLGGSLLDDIYGGARRMVGVGLGAGLGGGLGDFEDDKFFRVGKGKPEPRPVKPEMRGKGVAKRLVKGSQEAKEYMASIRKKKMAGGKIPAPPSRSPITDPSLL